MKNIPEMSMAAAYINQKLIRAEKTLRLNRRSFDLAIECRNALAAKKLGREIAAGQRRRKILETRLGELPALPYEIR